MCLNRARLWHLQKILTVRAIRVDRGSVRLGWNFCWDWEAEMLAKVNQGVAVFRAGNGFCASPIEVRDWCEAARQAAKARWSSCLETSHAGFATVEAH